MKVLNISHKDCLDGIVSAWLVKKAFCAPQDEVTTLFFPAGAALDFSQIPPGCLTLVTDTSFTVEELLKLESLGPVRVLDHHKTAIDRLGNTKFKTFLTDKISGALITYKYLTETVPKDWGIKLPPEAEILAQYVSDADTWSFNLYKSREIQAYLHHEIEKVEDVGPAALRLLLNFGACVNQGDVLLQAKAKQVRNAVDRAECMGGFHVVNSPVYQSEIGNALAKKSSAGFSIVWWAETVDRYRLSFRAVDDSGHCLRIAESLGGGGHVRACGASISRVDFRTLMDDLYWQFSVKP